jgi:hypothetical protein
MKGNPKKSGGSAPSGYGTAAGYTLGGGEGAAPVAVPRKVQSVVTQWIRTFDRINSLMGVVTFGAASSNVISLPAWLTASGSNWGALAGAYDEFQVESVRIRFSPVNQYNGTFGMNFPYLIAYDNDGGMPITPSVAQLAQYRACRMLSSGNDEEIVFEYSPQATGLWFNCSLPTTWPPQIGILPVTNQPSFIGNTPVVALYLEFKCRFRGVR